MSSETPVSVTMPEFNNTKSSETLAGSDIDTKPVFDVKYLYEVKVSDFYAVMAEFMGTLFFIFLALTTVQAALTNGTSVAISGQNPSTILLISTSFGLGLMVCIGKKMH